LSAYLYACMCACEYAYGRGRGYPPLQVVIKSRHNQTDSNITTVFYF
jgi:hypothetical protein